MIRCKFECTKIEGKGTSKEVTLETRYDPKLREDQRFTACTPCGFIKVTIDNPVALAQLKVGEKYYVDLVPLPAE